MELERGVFAEKPVSRDSRELRDSIDILETPQTVENKEKSGHLQDSQELHAIKAARLQSEFCVATPCPNLGTWVDLM